MKRHLQTILLGLSVLLILSSLVSVNAETAKTTTSQVMYRHYAASDHFRMYHRFLPPSTSKKLRYHTRMMAAANIDDTPEKETVVLIFVYPKWNTGLGNWRKAFLLITDNNAAVPKKKAFFKLFDTGTYKLDVSAAKAIELHGPPFVFTQPINVSFKLADLTGDGTLDVWVESVHGVALISFQDGEFKEVFSRYTMTKEKFTEVPEIEYHYYDSQFMLEGQMYHRFLPTPLPEGLSYNTGITAIANIDDTPEKENIALITAGKFGTPGREWVQAFLLITDNEAGRFPKKIELFKLFDSSTYDLDVPAAQSIELHYPSFVFQKRTNTDPWKYDSVFFRLVDLTGDGILDIWLERDWGVAVISFQNGALKEIFSSYKSYTDQIKEYIDLDNDGIYEIKIPNIIRIDGVREELFPKWTSLYKWNGTAYILNNERFYAENDEFLIRLLRQYNNLLIEYKKSETHSFYIGLVSYYRGNTSMARRYLQWIVKYGENDEFIEAAEIFLKKLTPQWR